MNLPATSSLSIQSENDLSRDDLLILHQRMKEALAIELGDPAYEPLTFTIRGSDKELVGGLVGYTFWGWLGYNVFWVEERYRRQGLGKRLLEAVEREAVGRNCRGAHTDTYSPEVASFAVRNGYELVHTIEAAGLATRRYSLVKIFRTEPNKPGPAAT